MLALGCHRRCAMGDDDILPSLKSEVESCGTNIVPYNMFIYESLAGPTRVGIDDVQEDCPDASFSLESRSKRVMPCPGIHCDILRIVVLCSTQKMVKPCRL